MSSWLDAASRPPDGLNATPDTTEAGPVSGMPRSSRGRAGSATFHTQTVSSWPPATEFPLPAARSPPSAENATVSTYPVGPVSGRPSGRARAGSVTFHSRTVSSALAAASVCPSGLNATE